jgi:DNA invertase Pin-like site-specific DNA recombinase
MASLAQMERELIGERTRDALQMKKSRGELVGSVPYGYVLHADGKTLIEDFEGQKIITLARDLRRQGYTFRRICTELEARGHRARTGKWHPQTVKNILKEMA